MNKLSIIFVALTVFISTNVYAGDDANTSYKQMRDKMLNKSANSKKPAMFSPAERQLMEQALQQYIKDNPHPGLKTDTRAPDFTLLNAFGKKVSLSTELKKGPVVLVFYRGAWCPFCSMHLHALQNSVAAFKKYNAQVIAITPQRPDKSSMQVKKDKFPFEIVSDLNDGVMKLYGLYYELTPELHALYKSKGLDVEKFNGTGRLGLPIPGTIIIGKDGLIKAVHADHDYKERMEPADIIKVLKTLK